LREITPFLRSCHVIIVHEEIKRKSENSIKLLYDGVLSTSAPGSNKWEGNEVHVRANMSSQEGMLENPGMFRNGTGSTFAHGEDVLFEFEGDL